MCIDTLRTGLIFLRHSIWGVCMPRFTLKMNVFPSISLETPQMCVETLRTGLVFTRHWIWGITCLGLLSKWMFFHLSAWKPINVCWNPQNRAQFSEMMDLRDHMSRFTLKWMFFHLSPWKPHKCVLKPSEQGSIFWDDQFEGSHA